MEAQLNTKSMFIDNKYTKWYWSIVDKALQRIPGPGIKYERHHILPKGKYLFPEFKSLKIHKWNGVSLTHKEHFVCHLLLTKMTTGKARSSCIYGLMRFSTGLDKCTSRQYAKARTLFSSTRKGDPNPHKGKPGRIWTDEAKVEHSKLMKQVMQDEDVRRKCSVAKKDKPGNKHTDISRSKISYAQRNLSPEQLARKSESKKGSKNGMYGTQWITNGVTSRLLSKDLPMPAGWAAGRVGVRKAAQ
jgi:hypothetical protein